MDRKSILIMVISLLFLAAWFPITNKLFPPIPVPTNTVSSVTNELPAATTDTTPSATLDAANVAPVITPPREEQFVTLENEKARYVFTSLGGALKTVELKGFKAEVGCDSKKLPTNRNVMINWHAPVPIMGVVQNGDSNTLAPFTISRTGDVVRAEAPLPGG